MSNKVNDIKNKFAGSKRRNAHERIMGKVETATSQENVNVNENNNDNVDLESVLKQHEENTNSKSDKELVGIYFDPDVKAALDAYQRNNKRGAKSSLVNDIARLALKQKGYL